jgi:hypothetical protein
MPEREVPIAIAVDGEIVAEGTADIDRPDLAEVGEGARGFLIPLPKSLQSPGRHRVLVLAGAESVPLEAAPSFWLDAGSGDGWSDVVFEPEDRRSGGAIPTKVPAPPAEAQRRAVVAADWLFDAHESEPTRELSETQLDDLVAALASVAHTCSSLGIFYIPAIIPTKRQALGFAPEEERQSIVALIARLRDVGHVELVDLLPVLRDAARHGAPFHRTDADWNDRGAFFAARALLKEAHKRVPALTAPSLANLHLRTVGDYRGTLADVPKFEALGDELVAVELDVEAEDGVVVDAHALHALRMPVASHLLEIGSVHLRTYAHSDRVEDTRIAIVGDSVGLALVPWLAEQARRTTFFWTQTLPLAQLELEMPQVVFHVLREADLLSGSLVDGVTHTVARNGISAPPQPTASATSKDMRAGLATTAAGASTVLATGANGTAPPAGTEPFETPVRGLAVPITLFGTALRGLATSAWGNTKKTSIALKAHARTIALVFLLTILSWPFVHVEGTPGLDESWVVGLSLAVAHGLTFGKQVIFTYGPLGFTVVPAAITPGLFLAGEVLGGLIQLALVAVLLANLRRRMSLLAASVLTLLAASLVGSVEAEPFSAIAFGLVALTFVTPATRREQAFRRLAIGGGALAGFALLVKLNDGIATSAVIAIGMLGSDLRRRDLLRAGVSMLGTLVTLWLLLGQPLGALPAYLRGSYDVVTGYVEAMGIPPGPEFQWQLLLVVGSAVVLTIAAWRALATERRRRSAALAGGVLVIHYFVAREAFLRYSPGHVAFIAVLSAVALMIPWPRAQRATGLALTAMLAVAALAVLAEPVEKIVDPLGDVSRLASQVGEVLHPAKLIAEGRQNVKIANAIPPAMEQALRGHCVSAEPDEIAAVWAHPNWRWCPLPAFQSYVAYTPRLDRLNAAAYADASHGPDRVLRSVSQAIDGRRAGWESPAAMLSLLCHFIEIEHNGQWQTLARVPDRCGTPYTVETVHSSLGHTIAMPSLPTKAVLLAAIEGIQVAGWERLETLFMRARDRFVSVNDIQNETQFRVPPATAADGLILSVPINSDYPAPFNLRMDPHTMKVEVEDHSSGSIAVRFFAVPITPNSASAAWLAASMASQASSTGPPSGKAIGGFRADTHRLPWLYDGQKLLSPQQILSLPEADRELADTALLGVEGLPLEQPSTKALQTAVPAVVSSRSPAMHVDETSIAGASHGCTLLKPSTSGDVAVISVAPGQGLYLGMHATGQVSIYAHRYANSFSSKLLHLLQSAGAPAIVRFPADSSTRPWQVELVPTTPTAVCLV